MALPQRSWKYGGIIPILPDQDLYLLGKEQDGIWSWFGGHSEPEDSSIYETAAREAYEESMGLLGSIDELKRRASRSIQIDSTFFVPLSLEEARSIPIAFERVYDYFSHCLSFSSKERACVMGCPEGYIEKIEMMWFSWPEMISSRAEISPKEIEVISLYRSLYLIR